MSAHMGFSIPAVLAKFALDVDQKFQQRSSAIDNKCDENTSRRDCLDALCIALKKKRIENSDCLSMEGEQDAALVDNARPFCEELLPDGVYRWKKDEIELLVGRLEAKIHGLNGANAHLDQQRNVVATAHTMCAKFQRDTSDLARRPEERMVANQRG